MYAGRQLVRIVFPRHGVGGCSVSPRLLGNGVHALYHVKSVLFVNPRAKTLFSFSYTARVFMPYSGFTLRGVIDLGASNASLCINAGKGNTCQMSVKGSDVTRR